MLKYPQFPIGAWIRTCQECNHAQVAKNPNEYKSDNWRNLKCRRCKSEGSMDFGTENTEDIEDVK